MELRNMNNYEYWVNKLELAKHVEGGYYKEVYKNSEAITDKELKSSFSGKRHLATSIYFLLTSEDASNFHRLKSDEIWYYHAGAPLTVYVIDEKGDLKELKVGLDIENGEQPQVIVPAGSIFGSMVNKENSFSLVGCMVSYGFDFHDFELFSREELLAKYPEHKDIILKLTRE